MSLVIKIINQQTENFFNHLELMKFVSGEISHLSKFILGLIQNLFSHIIGVNFHNLISLKRIY